MADHDPIPDRQDRNMEVPGDTDSADIVGRTGEQMPKQSHDGLESEERERGSRGDKDSDPIGDDTRHTPTRNDGDTP
jgi:hypothetical protein